MKYRWLDIEISSKESLGDVHDHCTVTERPDRIRPSGNKLLSDEALVAGRENGFQDGG